MRRDDIPTPALLLDLDRFEKNLARMAAHVRRAGKHLRPHAKTHRCPEIARRQVAAGALGVACAKLGEAEVMAGAGIRDILIANQIVGASKVTRLAHLQHHADVIVAVGANYLFGSQISNGVRCRFGAALHAEFSVDAAHMMLRRLRADEQALGDLAIRKPLSKEV